MNSDVATNTADKEDLGRSGQILRCVCGIFGSDDDDPKEEEQDLRSVLHSQGVMVTTLMVLTLCVQLFEYFFVKDTFWGVRILPYHIVMLLFMISLMLHLLYESKQTPVDSGRVTRSLAQLAITSPMGALYSGYLIARFLLCSHAHVNVGNVG